MTLVRDAERSATDRVPGRCRTVPTKLAVLARYFTVKGNTIPCAKWGLPSFASGMKHSAA